MLQQLERGIRQIPRQSPFQKVRTQCLYPFQQTTHTETHAQKQTHRHTHWETEKEICYYFIRRLSEHKEARMFNTDLGTKK